MPSTGIKELDEILGGGFPEHKVTVISGKEGSGRTTLSLAFALATQISCFRLPIIFDTKSSIEKKYLVKWLMTNFDENDFDENDFDENENDDEDMLILSQRLMVNFDDDRGEGDGEGGGEGEEDIEEGEDIEVSFALFQPGVITSPSNEWFMNFFKSLKGDNVKKDIIIIIDLFEGISDIAIELLRLMNIIVESQITTILITHDKPMRFITRGASVVLKTSFQKESDIIEIEVLKNKGGTIEHNKEINLSISQGVKNVISYIEGDYNRRN